MADYIKRIQSALQRKVSVSRKQIRDYMEELGVANCKHRGMKLQTSQF